MRQPHLVRTHCVQVIRDRRQPALCRTYNPHLFPKTAKSSKQPVFSGSELKLPMLRLRGVTAAFRGSFCRQTQAPFLRVQRRPDCLWARSGCHQTVPASLDLVLDRSISTGLFRSGRLRPARAADPALQVAMVIPINSSAAVVRWVVVAPWIRTLTSRGAEDVRRWRTTLPSFQAMPTMTLPRALRPLTEPSGHAFGSAGSSSISPACDWSSISAMPAQPPKLPSIWKGGCAQKRLGNHPAPPPS